MVVTICFRRASIPYCPNIRTVEKLAESDWAGHDNLGLAAVLRSCYFIADSVGLVHILVTEKSGPTKHCAKSAQFRNSPPTRRGLYRDRVSHSRFHQRSELFSSLSLSVSHSDMSSVGITTSLTCRRSVLAGSNSFRDPCLDKRCSEK